MSESRSLSYSTAAPLRITLSLCWLQTQARSLPGPRTHRRLKEWNEHERSQATGADCARAQNDNNNMSVSDVRVPTTEYNERESGGGVAAKYNGADPWRHT